MTGSSTEPDGSAAPWRGGALDMPAEAIEQLMAHLADETASSLTAQDRLRTLLRANRSIVGELSLAGVLERIVEAARDVSGARYAALGVVSPHGLLEQFIHVGMDDDVVAAIGRLPEGRGVLGALIENPEPIRLANITLDPRSSGFPAHHPQMTTFLGVPIRSHDEIFGNLYLTDRQGGAFTAEDEELVLALAATASIAIENARLYEESRQRQEWLRASGEISRRLLDPDTDHREILQRIADSVKRLADADVAGIVLPAEDSTVLAFEVVTGEGEDRLRGVRFQARGSLAWTAMQRGHGLLIDSLDQEEAQRVHLSRVGQVGAMMTFPLIGEGTPRGAIVAARLTGRRAFAPADLDMAEAFANHAAIALELSDARSDRERLAVLEDRDRIAQDLHDHVIQRLFAAGLTLQSTAAHSDNPEVRDRLNRTVTDLDGTIRQIRTSIFELRNLTDNRSLRTTVLSVIRQVAPLLKAAPDVRFSGPLDTLADEAVLADAEAVVREGLTNVVKHARARRVGVDVDATADQFSITITDDGIGLSPDLQHSGLLNLRHRAQRRGGDMALGDQSEGGTRLTWTIPLSS